MIPRHALATVIELAHGFPIGAITGPRQSGKTTLARAIFADRAVIDEAQRHPALFSFLQGLVDSRERMGDFVLTGSQQFGLCAGISQSLAGRVGLLQLLPLSFAEMTASPRGPREVKPGASVVPEWLQAARRWDGLARGEALPTRIVYGGDESYLREGCRLIGWREAATALD